MTRDDDPFERLAALPAHDIDAYRADQIRRRAHAALDEARRASPGWAAALQLFHTRVAPAAVAVLSVAYLGWALYIVVSLYR